MKKPLSYIIMFTGVMSLNISILSCSDASTAQKVPELTSEQQFKKKLIGYWQQHNFLLDSQIKFEPDGKGVEILYLTPNTNHIEERELYKSWKIKTGNYFNNGGTFLYVEIENCDRFFIDGDKYDELIQPYRGKSFYLCERGLEFMTSIETKGVNTNGSIYHKSLE